MPKKIVLFILIKFTLLILIALIAKQIIPYLGHFSFPADLKLYHGPSYLKAFANFDGLHYIKIAREGYYSGGYAFFPIYPLLIHILSSLFLGNHIFAALFISNVAFVIGCLYLYKLLKLLKISRAWFFTFFFLFPTSFFFQTAYSESLFFMLVTMTLYQIKNNKIGQASLLAILASATRLIGVFLFIPFLLKNIFEFKKGKKLSLIQVSSVIAPFVGLGIYVMYQWRAAGDPFAFIHAQTIFGAGRSTHIILLPQVYFRYLKILMTAQFNFQYFISALELILFTFVIITALIEAIKRYKTKDTFLFSVGLFSLASMTLPTLTGTFLSTPRFALLSLSTFIYLATLKNNPLKISLAVVFGVLQAVLFAFFIQGYFVA